MATAKTKKAVKESKKKDSTTPLPKEEKKLNPKQQQFALEYIIDFNATQAAIRAGYSKKTAGSIGSENLEKPEMQAAIQQAIEKRSQRTGITADRVLNELSIIAFSDMKDYVHIDENGSVGLIPFDDERMPEGASRAVSGIKETRRIIGSGEGGKEITLEVRQEYKHHDKVKCLELLGKHLGILKDKFEFSASDELINKILEARKRG